MNYVARKRCTCLSSTTIFANRIVPGQVHLPRHLRPLCPGVSPAHLNPGERRRPPRLYPRDVGLRRAGDEGKRGVAGVEVSDVGYLVGHHRAAAAGVVGPAEDAGLEERAVDDQLAAALE